MTSPTPTPHASSVGLVRIAMTRDEHLDDIKRARIWSELEDRLTTPAPSTRRWPLVLGASATGLVAAAAIIALVVRPSTPRDNALAIPADATVSAHLGPHTRASLVGPARLELDAVGESTTVHLRRGTLLADFAGGTGRSLQIVTHDARIEIVGTLFAVEVRDGAPTCTSVEHGRVRVTTHAHTVFVAAGQRYCVAEATTIDPIVPSVREALERHGASIVAAKAPGVGTPDINAPAANAPVAHAPIANAPVANAPASPAGVARAQSAGRSQVAPVATAPFASPTAPASPAPIHTTESRTRPSAPPISPPRTSPPATTSPRTSTAPTLAPMTSTPPATPPTTTPPTSATTATNAVNAPAAENSVVTHEPAAKTAPQPPQQTKPSAADLYQIADAALAARDLAAADRALATLVAEHRDSRLVEQALFDRARIAHQRRDWRAARQHLAALAAMSSKLLAEPAHWLRCRIDVDARDQRDASACLTEYRRAFPKSPHDLDALALLARLAHATGGCAAAATHVDELALRYPRTTLAAGWRARCPTITNPTSNRGSGAKP